MALEDVHPDAGPLGFYPGSNSIPFYWANPIAWGYGFFPSAEATKARRLRAPTERECERSGLSFERPLARKDDVLSWRRLACARWHARDLRADAQVVRDALLLALSAST